MDEIGCLFLLALGLLLFSVNPTLLIVLLLVLIFFSLNNEKR